MRQGRKKMTKIVIRAPSWARGPSVSLSLPRVMYRIEDIIYCCALRDKCVKKWITVPMLNARTWWPSPASCWTNNPTTLSLVAISQSCSVTLFSVASSSALLLTRYPSSLFPHMHACTHQNPFSIIKQHHFYLSYALTGPGSSFCHL